MYLDTIIKIRMKNKQKIPRHQNNSKNTNRNNIGRDKLNTLTHKYMTIDSPGLVQALQ